MKRVSWEIILGGLFLVAAAIYLIGKPSATENPAAAAVQNEQTAGISGEEVHVIHLRNLEELSQLKDLNSLKELEKLKELAHLIPSETRDEFLTEINNAVRDLSNEKVNIEIDLNDKLIVVDRNYDNLSAGEWGNTSPGIYTYLSKFDSKLLERAVLELPHGSIKIIGSNESEGKLTLQASGQIESVEDLKQQLGLNVQINDAEAVFSAQNLKENQNIQLQATLSLPENIRLTGTTNAGHIEVTNIEGVQTYQTQGGHIKLQQMRGEVTAVSSGGHVSVTDGAGTFILETKGGHVSAKNIQGSTTLSTYGGNVDAININGEINASTKGGNVTVSLSELDHSVTCETFAGNIVIGIPPTAGARIDLKASTAVEIEGLTVDGTLGKTNASGTINGGGPAITASTKFGKVVLKKND